MTKMYRIVEKTYSCNKFGENWLKFALYRWVKEPRRICLRVCVEKRREREGEGKEKGRKEDGG